MKNKCLNNFHTTFSSLNERRKKKKQTEKNPTTLFLNYRACSQGSLWHFMIKPPDPCISSFHTSTTSVMLHKFLEVCFGNKNSVRGSTEEIICAFAQNNAFEPIIYHILMSVRSSSSWQILFGLGKEPDNFSLLNLSIIGA